MKKDKKQKRVVGVKGHSVKGNKRGFYHVYSESQKKLIISEVIIKKLLTPKRSIRSLARQMRIPFSTFLGILKDSRFDQYKKRTKILFDVQANKILQNSLKRIGEKIKTASLSHATMAVGVLHDKIFGAQPITKINVRNSREIKVFYPKWPLGQSDI